MPTSEARLPRAWGMPARTVTLQAVLKAADLQLSVACINMCHLHKLLWAPHRLKRNIHRHGIGSVATAIISTGHLLWQRYTAC
jgi:hypothetical protein